MVKRRVIINFFDEASRNKAREKVQQFSETPSFILGEVEEDKIPELRQQKGLIVQILDGRQSIETSGKVYPEDPRANLDKDKFSSDEPACPTPSYAIEKLTNQTQPDLYIILLKGPLLPKWRKGINDLNITPISSIPYYNFTAKLGQTQINSVKALPYVEGVRVYNVPDAAVIGKGLEKQSTVSLPKDGLLKTYDIILHLEGDSQKVSDWLSVHEVNIYGASGKKIRFGLTGNSPLLAEIRRIPEVAQIQEFVQSQLHNDISRIILGIDKPNSIEITTGSNVLSNIEQTGADQIVAIADTGIYESHPDFKERIVGITSWRRRKRNEHNDPHGHGTHVAGSVLGNGMSSGGKIRGTAPGSKMFFQSLLEDNGEIFLPLNLADLFDEAYRAGARISNNSYGAPFHSLRFFPSRGFQSPCA